MAYNRFHRSLTAGVALVGAGAIAFAPVPPPLADEVVAAPVAFAATPRIVTTEVDLVALTTALQVLANGAAASIQESLSAYGTALPPMWDRVARDWADTDYLTLNYSLVVSSFLTPVAPLVVGPFTDAVAEVVGDAFPGSGDEVQQNITAAVDYAFARLVGPFISAFSAIAVAHLASYEAGMSGDPNARILAFLKAPLDIADGFLFGGYGDLGPLMTGDLDGERIVPPGLLTPWGQEPADRNFLPEPETDPSPSEAEDSAAEPTTLAVADEAAVNADDVVAEPVAAVDTEDTADVTDEAVVSDESEPAGSEADETTEATDEADETAAEEADEEKSTTSSVEKDAADTDSEDSAKSDDAPTTEKAEKPATDSADTE